MKLQSTFTLSSGKRNSNENTMNSTNTSQTQGKCNKVNSKDSVDTSPCESHTVTFRVEGRRIIVVRSALLRNSDYFRFFFADPERSALPEIEVRRARYTAVKAALHICAYHDDTLFTRLEKACDKIHHSLYTCNNKTLPVHRDAHKKYRSYLRVFLSFFETCMCFDMHVYACIAVRLLVQTHMNKDTVSLMWRVCERHSPSRRHVSRSASGSSSAESDPSSAHMLNLPLAQLRTHCLILMQCDNAATGISEPDAQMMKALMMLTDTVMTLRTKCADARTHNRTMLTRAFDRQVNGVTNYAHRNTRGLRALQKKACNLKRDIACYRQQEQFEWDKYYAELEYSESIKAYHIGLRRAKESMHKALHILHQSNRISKGDSEAVMHTLGCLVNEEEAICKRIDDAPKMELE